MFLLWPAPFRSLPTEHKPQSSDQPHMWEATNSDFFHWNSSTASINRRTLGFNPCSIELESCMLPRHTLGHPGWFGLLDQVRSSGVLNGSRQFPPPSSIHQDNCLRWNSHLSFWPRHGPLRFSVPFAMETCLLPQIWETDKPPFCLLTARCCFCITSTPSLIITQIPHPYIEKWMNMCN